MIDRLGSLWLGAGTGTRGGEDGGRAAHRAGARGARAIRTSAGEVKACIDV